MTIEQAKKYVADAIAKIERENPNGVLQPWAPDACAAASLWWGRVQQRIALSRPHPAGRWCCEELALEAKAPSVAQLRARETSGNRLRLSKAAV